jgi:WD40 repeat protein
MAMEVSRNGRWLVIGMSPDMLQLWDLSARNPGASSVVLRSPGRSSRPLVISPDGRWLVTAEYVSLFSPDSGPAQLWDLTAKDAATSSLTLGGHEKQITSAAISPNSRWLVTLSMDKTARVWDLAADNPAASSIVLRGHEGEMMSVAIDSGSRRLVTGSQDRTARLWDLAAEDPTASSLMLRGHESAIVQLEMGANGRWLVTRSVEGTVRLWDLIAKAPAASGVVVRGHEGPIKLVAVSPDGGWLVTATKDARLWDLDVDVLLARARRLAGRELALEERKMYLLDGQ